jgi:hypothetical protein
MTPAGATGPGGPGGGVVDRYIELGLRLGRHIDGLVDAYYGPPELARRVEAVPPVPPDALAAEARALLADIDAGAPLDGPAAPSTGAGAPAGADAARRRWLRAQVLGLRTTARRLAGEDISYADEVESCYGVRPHPFPEEEFAAAQARLDEALPGSGPLAERFVTWRESHAVQPDRLTAAIESLADDFRARTVTLFGLPDGEHVDFETVTDKPWSGFNTYLGNLRSLVSINTDLPVLSTSLAHLVAHEAYPGHHTEHARKEVGLVRRRRWAEETIFLVGTPQCLMAEGLADLGLEVIVGPRPEAVVAERLRPLGIRYDAEVIAAVAEAGQVLSNARANAAWRLFAGGEDPDAVVEYLIRWELLSRPRAEKAVANLLHPTWRAYISCYVEGLRLCRRFVGGDPARFARLLSEQLVPADLEAEAA